MIKPLGVLLLIGVVAFLIVCLVPALRGAVYLARAGARKRAAALAVLAAAIVVFSAWAVYFAAPKGARIVDSLELPDGHAFVLRHYRFSWLEYPKVRLYVRDPDGSWTTIAVIAELVNPNATTLVLDNSNQVVEVTGVGSYVIKDAFFVHIDGGGSASRKLPPGTEPGEEDLMWR